MDGWTNEADRGELVELGMVSKVTKRVREEKCNCGKVGRVLDNERYIRDFNFSHAQDRRTTGLMGLNGFVFLGFCFLVRVSDGYLMGSKVEANKFDPVVFKLRNENLWSPISSALRAHLSLSRFPLVTWRNGNSVLSYGGNLIKSI